MIRVHLHGKAPVRRRWPLALVVLGIAAWAVWQLVPAPPVGGPRDQEAGRQDVSNPGVPEKRPAPGPVATEAPAESSIREEGGALEKSLPDNDSRSGQTGQTGQGQTGQGQTESRAKPKLPVHGTEVVRASVARSSVPEKEADPGACLRVLDLARRVPAGIELALVRGNAAGEFLFEGRADDETTAKALKGEVPGASMSYWRSKGRLNFTLQGVLEVDGVEKTLTGSGGAFERLAKESGLRELTFKVQPRSAAGNKRQKMWGQGSLEEVRRFAASVVGVGGGLWREFVFDAVPGGGGRLYVALEQPTP